MVKPATCQPVTPIHQNAGRSSPVVNRGRSRYAAPSPPPTPTPPPKRQEIPLPLPKNVLLLSLMETAEREASALRYAKLKRCLNKADDEEDMDTIDETMHVDDTMSLAGECIEEDISTSFSFEEDEDAYVWSTISHISSACGTYAVADQAGLTVLPTKPSSKCDITTSDITSVFENVSLTNGKDYINKPASYELPYRSRVQVVHIEDGWAQLARNRGFVYIDSTQLVKVGGPNDKACEIEGMLLQVDNRRKEISRKQAELSRIENGLERELDKALLVQFTDDKRYELDIDEESKVNDVTSETPAGAQRQSPQKKNTREEEGQKSPKAVIKNVARNGIPKTPPPRQLRTPSPTASPDLVTRLLGLPQLSPSPVTVPNTNENTPPSLSSIAQPKRRSSRSKPNSPSSVVKTIDFRTGFSGHCALTQSFARHPHPDSRKVHRMMGEHRGLQLPSNSRLHNSVP